MKSPSPERTEDHVFGPLQRRRFLWNSLAWCAGTAAIGSMAPAAKTAQNRTLPRFGLVTYQWAKDWDLDTLLKNCAEAGITGVELRSTHRHGVEPEMSPAERAEVKRKFADSPVTFLGPGSDERFDSPDPEKLRQAIDRAKAFVQLSHETGGSGVKVKPDRFHPGVPEEKTIAQIAVSLREVADFAKELGQQIRLEIHGQLAAPTTIVKVMEACNHPHARLCWNCNDQDVETGGGFEANFRLARPWFGDTLHVHDLDGAFRPYPYDRLADLMLNTGYSGWCLLESSTKPADVVAALKRQKELFDGLMVR